jgi:hypothetical protein
MTYTYELINDEYLGLCVYEFENGSMDFRVELCYLKEDSGLVLVSLTEYGKVKLKRCKRWLFENHPELTL